MPVRPTERVTVPFGTRRKLWAIRQGDSKMEELRPDTTTDEPSKTELQKEDQFVAAPGEVIDDRDAEPCEFRVNEELSSTNTDFGGRDPAL